MTVSDNPPTPPTRRPAVGFPDNLEWAIIGEYSLLVYKRGNAPDPKRIAFEAGFAAARGTFIDCGPAYDAWSAENG